MENPVPLCLLWFPRDMFFLVGWFCSFSFSLCWFDGAASSYPAPWLLIHTACQLRGERHAVAICYLAGISFDFSIQMICFPLVFSLLICLCSTYQNSPKQCNECYVSMIIKAVVPKPLCKDLGFLGILSCIWKQLGLYVGKRYFWVWAVFLIPDWKIPKKASFLLSGLNSSGKWQSRFFFSIFQLCCENIWKILLPQC